MGPYTNATSARECSSNFARRSFRLSFIWLSNILIMHGPPCDIWARRNNCAPAKIRSIQYCRQVISTRSLREAAETAGQG